MVSCCISMFGLYCQHSLNVLLCCRTCSSVPTMNRTLFVIQFATLPFHLPNHLPKQSFLAISAPIKVFRLDSGRFKNLSNTKLTLHFQQKKGAVLFRSRHCFKSSISTLNSEALSGTFSATLRFTIHLFQQSKVYCKFQELFQKLN